MLGMGSDGRTFWRVSSYHDLNGIDGKLGSARWHTKGRLVVYLAENPAGAMLERLVHLIDADGRVPRSYDLLEIQCPDELEEMHLDPSGRSGWKWHESRTRAIGNRWLDSRKSALARIPSAVAPKTWNYLLNPEHPDAKRLQIVSVTRERFDNRLFRYRPS